MSVLNEPAMFFDVAPPFLLVFSRRPCPLATARSAEKSSPPFANRSGIRVPGKSQMTPPQEKKHLDIVDQMYYIPFIMRKERIYSLRLTSEMRKALDMAATRDRRSVASLLEKIIAEYLDREGIDWEKDSKYHNRREHPRKDVSLPARLIIQQPLETHKETEALVENMSLGGAYVTYTNGQSSPWELKSKINLIVRIPKSADPLKLSCRAVRVTRDEQRVGVGLQYGKVDEEDFSLIERYLRAGPGPPPSNPSLN